MNVLGIIPARYASTRFPGKPLADIAGKPMIQRVYEQCLKAKRLSSVVVATDDQRIFDAVECFGGIAIMTGSNHLNGTSRCAEALEKIASNPELTGNKSFDYVLNIQGDEPCIHPNQIDELINLFEDPNAIIVTQAIKELNNENYHNPNIVKVMLDDQSFAKDFFRTTPSKSMNDGYFLRHVGIYGFKSEIFKIIHQLEATNNEKERKLEQLRWLDNQFHIKVGITTHISKSVDTPEDLEKILYICEQ